MRLWLAAGACCLAVSAVADEPPRHPAEPRLAIRPISYAMTLVDQAYPTGLRVVLHPDRSTPVVSVTTVFRRGLEHDPVGKEGLAHLVEHLWFRSVHLRQAETYRVLEDLGCVVQAYTLPSQTEFTTVCQATVLTQVLQLESARFTDPLAGVDEAVFATERDVVRAEYRSKMDPIGEATALLQERMFPDDHPYGRLGEARLDTLAGLTLDDARAFAAEHYRPEHAVMAVAGDFDARTMADTMVAHMHRRLFSDDPDATTPAPHGWTGEPPIVPSVPPAPNPGDILHTTGQLEDTLALIGWSLPPGFTPVDRHFDDVAYGASLQTRQLIGNHESRGRCAVADGPAASVLLCQVRVHERVDPEQLAHKVARKVHNRATRIIPSPGPPRWLYHSMGATRSIVHRDPERERQLDLVLAWEPIASVDGRSHRIARHATWTGSATAFEDQVDALDEGRRRKAMADTKRWLHPDRAVIVIVQPATGEPPAPDDVPATHLRGAIALGGPSGGDDVGAQAVIDAAHPPDLRALEHRVLDNGMQVVAYRNTDSPFADVRLYVRNAGPEMAMVGQAYLRQPRMPATVLPGRWYRLDAPGLHGLRLLAGVHNLEAALYMLRDTLDNTAVGNNRTGRWTRPGERIVEEWMFEPEYWYDRLESDTLDAGNPVRHVTTLDDMTEMRQRSRAEVRSSLTRTWQPANAVLVLVGNVDAVYMADRARHYFGGWRQPGTDEGPFPPLAVHQPPPTEAVHLFDEPIASLTRVRFLCTLAPGTDGHMQRQVAAALAAGTAFTAVRARSGSAYAVDAGIDAFVNGYNQLWIEAEVAVGSTAQVVSQLYEITGGLEAGALTQADLDRAKLGHALRTTVTQETVDEVADQVARPVLDGTGFEPYADYGERLAAMEVTDVAAVMAGCSAHRVVTLAGPATRVAPQLDDAGIAYHLVDWEALALAELERVSPSRAARRRRRAGATP